METSITEALVLPWWKPAVYIVITTLGIIAIRISVKFDVNAWMKDRKEAQRLKARQKASSKCQHIWTLYPSSPYSRCDKCLTLISTSILLSASAYLETKPVISGELHGMMVKPGKNELVTFNYDGAKR